MKGFCRFLVKNQDFGTLHIFLYNLTLFKRFDVPIVTCCSRHWLLPSWAPQDIEEVVVKRLLIDIGLLFVEASLHNSSCIVGCFYLWEGNHLKNCFYNPWSCWSIFMGQKKRLNWILTLTKYLTLRIFVSSVGTFHFHHRPYLSKQVFNHSWSELWYPIWQTHNHWGLTWNKVRNITDFKRNFSLYLGFWIRKKKKWVNKLEEPSSVGLGGLLRRLSKRDRDRSDTQRNPMVMKTSFVILAL